MKPWRVTDRSGLAPGMVIDAVSHAEAVKHFARFVGATEIGELRGCFVPALASTGWMVRIVTSQGVRHVDVVAAVRE